MKKAARKARETLERINGPRPIVAPGTFGEKMKVEKQRRDESKYHKGSCDMRRIVDPDKAEAAWDQVRPGDFWWGEEQATAGSTNYRYRVLWAKYPDGCMACLPVDMPPEVKTAGIRHASWQHDGNLERPTLSPSVHHIGHWHGYVRAGRMVSV